MTNDEGLKQRDRLTWLVRVRGVDAQTGRMAERKATVRGTKAEARLVRDRLRAELRDERSHPTRLRLSEYSAQWLELRVSSLKAPTAKKYGDDLRKILALLGDRFVDTLTPADVRRYLVLREGQTTRFGRPPAGNTLLNELRLLRTIAKDSVAEKHATDDWCARVAPPEGRRYSEDDPNLLTADEMQALIRAVPDRWRALVVVLATTGLRIGEATALTWGDLDDATRTLTVRRRNWRGLLGAPKTTGSRRVVPLLPLVRSMLGERREPGVLLFANDAGGLYKFPPLRKVLDKAATVAKVRRITTHGLRRSFNDLARQHATSIQARAIMGHADEAMTSHYAVVRSDELAGVTGAVADAMRLESATGVLLVYRPTREDFQPRDDDGFSRRKPPVS